MTYRETPTHAVDEGGKSVEYSHSSSSGTNTVEVVLNYDLQQSRQNNGNHLRQLSVTDLVAKLYQGGNTCVLYHLIYYYTTTLSTSLEMQTLYYKSTTSYSVHSGDTLCTPL